MEHVKLRRAARTGDGARSVRSRAALFVASAAMPLFGCDSGQLPNDARLSITPEEKTIQIVEYRDAQGRCISQDGYFVDQPVMLRLTDGAGSPIGDAEVSLYVDFTENAFSGNSPIALFEDRNGNGILDADAELVSAAGDAIARVRTDDDSGARMMLLRIDLSCTFRGELVAFSDGVSAGASLEVEATEVVTIGVPGDSDPAGQASSR